MKTKSHTVLGVFARSLLRADLVDGDWTIRTAPRATGSSVVEAFGMAISLEGGMGSRVWLLSDEWFSQTLTLNPAQVSGLSEEQLGRALAFEAEPFSGIPISSAAVGFIKTGPGSFDVIATHAETRSRLLALAGNGFAGIASCQTPPDDEASRLEWLRGTVGALEKGEVAVLGAPKAAPSPQRFRKAAVWMAIAALFALGFAWWMIRSETRSLRKTHGEFAELSRQVTSTRQRIQAESSQVERLRKDLESAAGTNARRLALPAMLQGLATQKLDEVVVRAIKDNGPSSAEISGVSLTSDAVDELGIAMKESLVASGWMVFPGPRKALRRLPNGGPWEFTLSVVHKEAQAEGVRFEDEEEMR